MSAVTNQQNSQQLIPLPFPEEKYPELNKTIAKVFFVVSITAFFTFFGFTLSCSSLNITVLTGPILLGGAGLILGIFLSRLLPFPSKEGKYYLDTLRQIQAIIVSDKGKEALNNLYDFLRYPLVEFSQTFHNHLFHDNISKISKEIHPDRKDAKKVWEVFLKHLHGTKVKNPDGNSVELDFSIELEKLAGKKIETVTETLNPLSSTFDEDLEEIVKIEKVAFGKIGTFSKEHLKQIFLIDSKSYCVVDREKQTKEILGFAWCMSAEEGITIAGVGRKPKASGLGVGTHVLWEILLKQPITPPSPPPPIQLHVRKSNPALKFYETAFFVPVEIKKDFYQEGPKEDAILMKFDWRRYLESVEKQSEEAS